MSKKAEKRYVGFIVALGFLIWSLVGVIISQDTGTALWTFHTDFPTDPLDTTGDATWVTPAFGGNYIIFKSAGVNFLTDDKAIGWHLVYYDEAQPTSQDVSCLQSFRYGDDNDHYMGCMFRVDDTDYANSGHIVVTVRGGPLSLGGVVAIYEYTGNTQDNIVLLPSEAKSIGTISGGGTIGITIQGAGTSTIIRTWNFDVTPPSSPFAPSTWGTCNYGFSNSSSGSGCTTHHNVSTISPGFSASGYADGYSMGLQHADVGADANAGPKEIWFAECVSCG